jgi:hypothetical protein
MKILRFILLIMIMIVLLRVGQDNPYIGFSLYLFLSVSFVLYTNNVVECEDLKFEREMLKTPEGRRRYYELINSR